MLKTNKLMKWSRWCPGGGSTPANLKTGRYTLRELAQWTCTCTFRKKNDLARSPEGKITKNTSVATLCSSLRAQHAHGHLTRGILVHLQRRFRLPIVPPAFGKNFPNRKVCGHITKEMSKNLHRWLWDRAVKLKPQKPLRPHRFRKRLHIEVSSWKVPTKNWRHLSGSHFRCIGNGTRIILHIIKDEFMTCFSSDISIVPNIRKKMNSESLGYGAISYEPREIKVLQWLVTCTHCPLSMMTT